MDGKTPISKTKRKFLKKKINDMREKIKNKTTNMHWHLINHLVHNNDLIVMGKFNVQSILRSNTIAKYSKRVLSMLEHYAFKQRLRYKCQLHGVYLRIHSEWGTTIGCPCCGRVNRMSLAEREYTCQGCSYHAERDAKSACCILLKYLANVW
jgi:IS605 OrfB family transposase